MTLLIIIQYQLEHLLLQTSGTACALIRMNVLQYLFRAYTHDPMYYLEPFEFNPDRFIPNYETDPSIVPPDPRLFVFGFGRRFVLSLGSFLKLSIWRVYLIRRCPGNELANNLLYIMIATTLALFKILPEVDGDGQPIIPEVEYTTTLTRCGLPHLEKRQNWQLESHPVPFQCKIVPRSQGAASLVRYGADTWD